MIVNAYWKSSTFGVLPMSDELQKEIEVGHKPKMGGKRKKKSDPSKAVKIPMKNHEAH